MGMSSKNAPTAATLSASANPDNSLGSAHVEQQSQQNRARLYAQIAAVGTLSNAMTLGNFSGYTTGEMDLLECANALIDQAKKVNGGDLYSVEVMLSMQASALNAIFGEMARRAALNIGENLDVAERYMRMALKAQGQSRATMETLAAIKQGPMVFARQANIAHGPQQVNNGAAAPLGAVARPDGADSRKNELLEANNGERLDTRTASAPGRGNPALAPVGEVDRPPNGRGKGESLA